uniref:Bestrophin homolog n=1 Tax=Heterorhabditis bacteriophora TaxID=37862 RepID=A0A1I7X4E9_HETBA
MPDGDDVRDSPPPPPHCETLTDEENGHSETEPGQNRKLIEREFKTQLTIIASRWTYGIVPIVVDGLVFIFASAFVCDSILVKCGPLYAKMHVELFLCPGIHQPCIELEGEELISFTLNIFWTHFILEFFIQFTIAYQYMYIFQNIIWFQTEDRRGSANAQKTATQISQLLNNQLLGQTQCNIDASTFSHLMQLSSVLNNNSNNNNNNNINTTMTPSFSIPPSLSTQSTHDVKDELVDVDDTMTNEFSPIPPQPMPPSAEQIVRLMNTVAPALTRVISSLNLSDVIVTFIRAKQMQSLLTPNQMSDRSRIDDKPRLSTDYSSVEDCVRKRSVDESSHSSHSQSSPPPFEVKRPRVQYPIGMLSASPTEGMDAKVLQALVQAQMHLNQSNHMDFLLSLSNLHSAPSINTKINEPLLTMK